MRKIAVQDANILIDLARAAMIPHCMKLDYQFITSALVIDEIDEEQQLVLAPFIAAGRLLIIAPADDELEIIQQLAIENKKLSEQDLSAFLLAKKNAAILLTGDSILRKFAEAEQVEVYGMLWILDCLVELLIITASEAVVYLRACLENKSRLPEVEFKKRFEE